MRRVLAPRWLALHAFVLVVAVLFCRLGWWQLDQARATGGVQNLIYALQWPSFAAFGLYLWWQTVWDELHPESAPKSRRHAHKPAVAVEVARSATPADEPEDEELAAYNRYLAWLNAKEEQRQR